MSNIRIFPHQRVHRDDPEPAIGDLLDDPITHAVMRRDGVTRQTLVQTLEIARLRLGLGARAPRAAAVPELCCA
jgi:hypothetical protein